MNGDIIISKKLLLLSLFIFFAMTCNSQIRSVPAPYYRCQDIGSSYQICPDRKGDYKNGTISYNSQDVKGVDVKTFEVFEDGYARDKNSAYHRGEVLEGVNPKEFIYLGGRYAKDSSNIFCHGIRMLGVDMGTFEIVADSPYSKDLYAVYFNGVQIVNANPQSFSIITLVTPTNYSKDGINIFYREKKIEKADYSTFEVLGDHSTARDKNTVYYAGRIIDYIDPATVETYEYSPYKSDKNHVYYRLDRLDKVDRATFEYLGRGYIRDNNSIYHDGKILEGADPQTFEIYQWMHGDAKDKNGYYNYGRKLTYDPLNY